MRILLFAATLCAAAVLLPSDARALRPGDNNNQGGSAGNQSDKNNQSYQDGSNNNQQQMNDNEKHKNNNSNSNSNSNNNSNQDNRQGSDKNRGSYVDRNQQLGDQSFDKHRVGALDESKYKDRKDNDWRYRHWGREWWYWVPAGYWMYWRDGRWVRYDDSYVDEYRSNTQNASSHGPYFEDQNGFYYMDSGRRVYDPQIRRIAG